MISVLLVDDHLVVRAGLRALLDSQADIEVVAEADTGEAGVAMAAELKPDLVMMDLALGAGIDGVEAIRRIRGARDGQPVIVFTTYDTDTDVVRALDAGAVGYLLKDSAPRDIFAAIRGAVAGQSVLSPPVAARVLDKMRRPDLALTAREAELLSLLAEGLTNRELGRRLFISEATVKTHLAHIYAKLGVDSRAAAVSIAFRRDSIR